MRLPEICIRRPVLSIVMNLVLLIVGAVTYQYLSLREYPKVDYPIISVITQYVGASPTIVESRITKPLESTLAGIEGLDFMTSVSESENSKINLYFQSKRSIDAAASDVRDRLSRSKAKLPEGVRDPLIKKSDADSIAIISLALHGDMYDTSELYDYGHHYLESELESIGGIASVELYGSSGYVMHIWLDPVKMAAHQVTTHDVNIALRQQNIHIPAGRLIGASKEFMITTAATLKNVEAFNNVIVRRTPNHLVRLQDIGRAEFSPGEERAVTRYNKKPAISVELIKKSTANPLDISKDLRKMLPDIRKKLPKGMQLEIVYDRSVYISESLNEVQKTFFEATICVVAVILLFLWSLRATLIPLVTIPISIITTAALMYVFGFSLNTLTMLAIVLAIGLVVDDAIVVMENIHRYLEEGLKPKEAAIKGSKEIAFAVIAMTLTLAAVYAPIALSKGTVGMFFTEFALTLAGAMIVSGFVALTLTPMMCAHLLKYHPPVSPTESQNFNLYQRIKHFDIDQFHRRFENFYHKRLQWVMNHRKFILTSTVIYLAIGSWIGFKSLSSELAPKEDQGIIIAGAMVPQGATLPAMDKYMRQVEDIMGNIPEVTHQLVMVGAPNPRGWNTLTPWHERKRSSLEIIDEIRPALKAITGLHAYAYGGSNMISGGSSDETIKFVLQTTKQQSELDTASYILESALRKARIIPYLKTDRGEDTPEYIIEVNRDKAALMGVDVSTIGETFDTFISGRRVSDFRRESEQFDVLASVREASKRSVEDLSGMYVRGHQGSYRDTMIPLSNLVKIKKEAVPVQINHYNQLRSVTLSGDLAEGVSLGTAVLRIQEIAEKVLPEGITTEFAGETKQYLETRYTIFLIFGLALVFIYLIMAAQFESFVDPLIIMFTVPLSLAGAVITLKLVGGSLNIYSQIGLITLIGLITKHGILMVDFANNIQQAGNKSLAESIVEAAKLRLRPILMTTAAMVLGAIPLVMASGAGAISRQQIGWVILGGMSLGTFFTLFIIPVIYTLLARPKVNETPEALEITQS